MAELPIPFSAPMVRALLREIEAPGTGKTQTRRALKFISPKQGLNQRLQTPRYAVGDRLYVREHWRAEASYDSTPPRDIEPDACNVFYEADGKWSDRDQMNRTGRFRQAMHMPRWASRITLLVTDVRVERLQDCSEADAWAEGCIKGGPDDVGGFFPAEEPDPSGIGWRGWDNARDWYADLWDQINGPGAWDLNPWVAAYSFRPILGNIDLPREAPDA